MSYKSLKNDQKPMKSIRNIVMYTALLALVLIMPLHQVFAISPVFLQTEQERQGDYYKIAIKAFNSPGYEFSSHGDYVTNAVVMVNVMNQTIRGTTDQFGYFEGGFYVPRDQAIGGYDVEAAINGQLFNVGKTFVTHWVPPDGHSGQGGGGGGGGED